MPRRFWIASLGFWPGLPQIWAGQEILGLSLAIGFAAALNLAIVGQFVWTEWLGAGGPPAAFLLALAIWGGSFLYTLWWVWRCHPERHRVEIDRLFREGVEHYLLGRWDEARRRFERIVELDETDADALIQLGTLFVRTGQPAAARRAFRRCGELDGGGKWRWEIGQALTNLGGE